MIRNDKNIKSDKIILYDDYDTDIIHNDIMRYIQYDQCDDVILCE